MKRTGSSNNIDRPMLTPLQVCEELNIPRWKLYKS